MDDNKLKIIELTGKFVNEKLLGADSAHDFTHISRVVNNAKLIANGLDVDLFIVEMGALLHDMSDYKLFGDVDLALKNVSDFLIGINCEVSDVEHLLKIIPNVSFSSRFSGEISLEFDVVCDADRLDALGAIGIARCFAYGGAKGNPIYDLSVEPNLNKTAEEYKAGGSPSINHFYEKCFLLPGLMRTDSGWEIAESRTDFLRSFLKQFDLEIAGKK